MNKNSNNFVTGGKRKIIINYGDNNTGIIGLALIGLALTILFWHTIVSLLMWVVISAVFIVTGYYLAKSIYEIYLNRKPVPRAMPVNITPTAKRLPGNNVFSNQYCPVQVKDSGENSNGKARIIQKR